MSTMEPDATGAWPNIVPDAILAHPNFDAARCRYIDAIIAQHEYRPGNRFLLEAGRSAVFFVILCLHAGYDENDRATWPTKAAVKEAMRAFRLSSPRRIDAIIARLIDTGFVEAVPCVRDRRAQILTPTQKMLRHDRDWLAIDYEPLKTLFPSPGYSLAMDHDPDLQKAQRRAGARLFADIARHRMENPKTMFFARREAGLLVLMKLLQLGRESPEGVSHPASFADLGERFGVSRTHIRIVLHDAERIGLLKMSDRGVILAPELASEFDRFLANQMSENDRLFRAAMSEIGRHSRSKR
ncbi:hypothetical protein [Methylocapsa sp. S129]|uniref:hypothetical protein n=1 Tax=Methylocapsa sp. S129 TaxID=1641869 RepID=UPI001FEFC58A|nr:hypothetical protein [Methylocapsa sp. S129]